MTIQMYDATKWHLVVKDGRQCWHHMENDSDFAQSYLEKYWSGNLSEQDHEFLEKPTSIFDYAKNGFFFFQKLLTEDGHWAGEYGGPLFLIPGLVISCYVSGTDLDDAQKYEIIRYLHSVQRPDGSWGLHIAGDGSLMSTVLNYVSARILGVSASQQSCIKARSFILKHGGAEYSASWAKFWLAVLNVYDWTGLNPLIPELWLLPNFVPFHPSKMWCHCRQIYLPMSYLYSKKICSPLTEMVSQIRSEIYPINYSSINWFDARDKVATIDSYAPHHWLLNLANSVMSVYEDFHIPTLRRMAMSEVLKQVEFEDDNTNSIGIGPISKMINFLVIWDSHGKDSERFKTHVDRIRDYLWIAEDGMRMQGTNGSQLWDTALAAQAFIEAGLMKFEHFQETFKKVYQFLTLSQISENIPNYKECYRQPTRGAFPFSTAECGWTVSDCTAEGLKSLLMIQNSNLFPKLVSEELIFSGIDVLLSMQNSDGGFASYEKRRGPFWLEYFNPSDVFGEIMVDYSYVECSSAVIQALACFRKFHHDYRRKDIEICIKKAISFIKSQQLNDGSWFGSWGICFTYATWFALEALAAVGETYENSESSKRGCDFLVSKILPDGGWGESYHSCFEKRYIDTKVSQVVNTSWACLGLMTAKYPDEKIINRGIDLICGRQTPWGEWKQEEIEGVFNKTCMISYPNYKFIFPIWALGRYHNNFIKK